MCKLCMLLEEEREEKEDQECILGRKGLGLGFLYQCNNCCK